MSIVLHGHFPAIYFSNWVIGLKDNMLPCIYLSNFVLHFASVHVLQNDSLIYTALLNHLFSR